jgi:hypothetical protein
VPSHACCTLVTATHPTPWPAALFAPAAAKVCHVVCVAPRRACALHALSVSAGTRCAPCCTAACNDANRELAQLRGRAAQLEAALEAASSDSDRALASLQARCGTEGGVL